VVTKYVTMQVNEQLRELCSTAQDKDTNLLVTKWMKRARVQKLDNFTQRDDHWAPVVIPLGHDGGIGHANTIVGNLVFDSTQTLALKCGMKALDWCWCANYHGFQGIFF
jgi:hypothetical protein